MSYPFSATFRDLLASACADFPRIPYEGPELKRSAVAVVLTQADDESGETAFLLTRRSPRLNAHAGQWALPGGRLDPGETLEEAALRELHEELGLRLEPQHILGVLDDYATRTGYSISPVITWLEDASALAPNPAEVASVHHVRLDHIGRQESVEFFSIPESERPVIRLHFDGNKVHAPTAALVYQLRELIAGRITRVAELEQPVFAWK